ncbi:MAG: hypothetical protein IJW08_10395 [Lentisphaeria bacterium]|nr:hypothetical protein [Lentisphaeria bacterium]MBQ7396936.1 hypothetical protein [Lentisphaeria bacterium]
MKKIVFSIVFALAASVVWADGSEAKYPQKVSQYSSDELEIRKVLTADMRSWLTMELNEALYAPEYVSIDKDGNASTLKITKKFVAFLKFLQSWQPDKKSALQLLTFLSDQDIAKEIGIPPEQRTEMSQLIDVLKKSDDQKTLEGFIDSFKPVIQEMLKDMKLFIKTYNETFKIVSVKITGDKAVAVCRAFNCDEKKDDIEQYELAKRDGRWIIIKSKSIEPESKNKTPQKKETTPAPSDILSSREYSVPCLTVLNDGTHGKISYLPLKFTRTKENKPLRIMIADDTPNGSGNTIHSSVWLAAITAAMLRNDTMHGTTISVEFSGNIDGPSAGAVTCLAILSALDGRRLPDDFAMTGTILPDGTIGVVGGVSGKMRAAAKAGKKRIFIPALMRFEKNAKGENTDLQRLADELNVELYRVENISEAYITLHNLKPLNNLHTNIRNMTRLPQSTEDVLTATYKKYLERVQAEVKAQPKGVQQTILPDYVLSPLPAEKLYQEGKLFPATLQIIRTWQAWQARKKTDKFFTDFFKGHNPDWEKIQYLREYHYRKLLFALWESKNKYVGNCVKEFKKNDEAYIKKNYGTKKNSGYFPFKAGQSEFSAQLEPVDFNPKFVGILDGLSARKGNPQTVNTASMKELEEYWSTEVKMLDITHLFLQPRNEYNDFLAALAATLPDKKANKRASEVERLFFSASYAANNVADDNFRNAFGSQASAKNAEEELKRNPYIMQFIQMQNDARKLHEQLEPDSKEKATFPEYHLQASLKAQVTTFTMASAILVMYGPDSSNDFTSHLLRNARDAAIRNISECNKAGIPCVAAICDFETAESAGEDAVIEVLMAYWRASLYAKALLMSFK